MADRELHGDGGLRVTLDRGRMKSDEGSALLMALVFVLVIGLVVTALLNETFANQKTTHLVRAFTDKSHAADTGLEHGIQQVRVDRTLCPSVDSGEEPLAPLVVDGRTVEIGCVTEGGASSGAEGWAVIAHSTNPDAITTQSGTANPKQINGPVFAVNLPNAFNPDLEVRGGAVLEQFGTGCSSLTASPPSGLVVGPTPPFRYRCADRAVPEPVHTLPSARPAPAAAPTTVGDCKVFHPGTYTTAPVLDDHNFFESGTYYFENIGTFAIKQQTVIAGDRNQLESGPINSRPSLCEPLLTPDGATENTGAKWIFGGNTRLDVQNQGSVELFARTAVPVGADEGQAGISLHAVTAAEASPGVFMASTVPTTERLVDVSGGTTAELAIHGMVYAPASFIDFFATNTSEAQLRGGVVVWRIHLRASASATGLVVSVKNAPFERVTRIHAICCSDASDNTVDVKAEAVLTYHNNTDSTFDVGTWHVATYSPPP